MYTLLTLPGSARVANALDGDRANHDVTQEVRHIRLRRILFLSTALFGIGILSGCAKANLAGTSTPTQATTPQSQSPCSSSAPSTASTAGYSTLAFCDDFNSATTIDSASTGAAGFKWYTELPFGWGKTSTTAYSISNSVLHVTSNPNTANWGLSSMDPISGNGSYWKFGYFEAKIRFSAPSSAVKDGFPAVWLFSVYHTLKGNKDKWPELDIFEAKQSGSGTYSGEFAGTLHEWLNSSHAQYSNSNNLQFTSVDWTSWHIVSVSWQKGLVSWYLDGNLLMTQAYSADGNPNPLAAAQNIEGTQNGTFNSLDSQSPGMQIILGSDPNWPMDVDWVRVWQ